MTFTTALNFGKNRLRSIFRRSSRNISSFPTIAEESIARYCQGGYHPVRIGDIFEDGKYRIVSKLGYGVYSTVWLAFNADTKHHVALKVLTADSFGHRKDTFELDILKHIRTHANKHPGASHILGLLDDFEHQGPNGTHVCLVFKAMGPDMSHYRRLFPKLRIPEPLLKEISKQLLLSLSYLHDTCRVIHADIKPQNILVESTAINEMFEQAPSEVFEPHAPPMDPPNDFYIASTQLSSAEEDVTNPAGFSVRLADYGTSSWFDNHLTEWIQPDKLRAPEVILGANWDHKVDIWNLGLIIWEFAEGKFLFDGTWTPNSPYTPEAHLAQMSAVLGDIPISLLARSKNRNQYFDADGKLHKPSTFPPCSLEKFSSMKNVSGLENRKFLDFIKSMISLDPEERLDATRLLESDWLRSSL